MKVYEIVKEDRQKVDELAFLAAPLVLPVIGTVTIGGLLAAVSAVLTVMDIVEIYKLSKKLATEPDKMTEEDYMDLFISVVLMLPLIKYLPGAVKKSITKAIPDSWKKEGGKKVKEIIDKKKEKVDAPKPDKSPDASKKDKSPETPAKKGGKLKTAATLGAGGVIGAAAVDGGGIIDKAKSTISGAIDSVVDKATGTSKTVDGERLSKDDPLYKYARWFGRVQ